MTAVAQGLTTVKVNVEGDTSVGEVPYVTPFTVTDWTLTEYDPASDTSILGPTRQFPAASILLKVVDKAGVTATVHPVAGQLQAGVYSV